MTLPGDPELAALAHALDSGALPLSDPARVAVLNARPGSGLPLPGWRLFQDDAALAAALQAQGGQVAGTDAVQGGFDCAVVLAPRSRDLCRILLARAASVSAAGTVVAVAGNQSGAGALQTDLKALAGPPCSLAKHRCKVLWSAPGAAVDSELRARWAALDAPVRNAEGWWSRPGLFAWDRVDPGSALLAASLPADLSGSAADLGAGFGFLAGSLLRRCPAIASIDLFESDRRALDPARLNLAACAGGRQARLHWHDVTAGIPGRYDLIVSNPPFHARDRADRPELGQAFIAAAAAALVPGGSLWLVANRHLPYEAILAARFRDVRVVAEEAGYKVLQGEAPR
ncbi:MAG: class I SAM-dependent methyltransferase [Xanthomonadales bacterium]|nr:class I SAM-dependent methyltransferase [Xanthomonadales bacterium]